jgi:hypothetical protein
MVDDQPKLLKVIPNMLSQSLTMVWKKRATRKRVTTRKGKKKYTKKMKKTTRRSGGGSSLQSIAGKGFNPDACAMLTINSRIIKVRENMQAHAKALDLKMAKLYGNPSKSAQSQLEAMGKAKQQAEQIAGANQASDAGYGALFACATADPLSLAKAKAQLEDS